MILNDELIRFKQVNDEQKKKTIDRLSELNNKIAVNE